MEVHWFRYQVGAGDIEDTITQGVRGHHGANAIRGSRRYMVHLRYGMTPSTVHWSESMSALGAYGGWLYGAGVTSSASRVKVLIPATADTSGKVIPKMTRL